ncbi:hypothetical protein [Hymenobacter gelipurpurascens]|nr:hypothetical protein [Hymenobacter gelipurpurascens]
MQSSQQDSSTVATIDDCPNSDDFDADAGALFESIQKAKGLTKNHRNGRPHLAGNCNRGRAYYFKKEIVQTIMEQDSAVGIRIYNTRDGGDKDGVIIVAVNRKGKDLLGSIPNKGASIAKFASYRMGETDMKCPHNCDLDSPLNKD